MCLLAFGPEGLAYAMTFFAVQCLLMFTVGEAIYAGSASLVARAALAHPARHLARRAGARSLEAPIPAVALETLSLLGQIVIPLMLITLGVSLAGMRARSLPSSLVQSAVRTALAVPIGFGVAALFSLEGVARGVLIIETAVPVAVFNFLLAEKHGRDSAEVSGLILVTHVGGGVLPAAVARRAARLTLPVARRDPQSTAPALSGVMSSPSGVSTPFLRNTFP